MKKNILLIVLMFFFVACETGTRYDKNATIQKNPKHEIQSGLVERDDISALLDKDTESEIELYYDEGDEIIAEGISEELELGDFFASKSKNRLDVRRIREGKHEDYIRLVFDVYEENSPAKMVGNYDAKYSQRKQDIVLILHGYQKFSAPLPSFPNYSAVEQIHFDQYPEERGFKLHIKLREDAKVKIFDLKDPARIVFDIKAI